MENQISLICSTYNSMDFIGGYLESVNSLMHPNFEIFFVDADSTDGSFEVIKNFTFRKGITPIFSKPGGRMPLYDAWQYAIEATNCEYIMNYNVDDRLNPFSLAIYQSYINSHPDIDFFYGKHNFIENLHTREVLPVTHKLQKMIENLSSISEEKLMFTLCPCGPFPLIKRSSLLKAGKFDSKYFSAGDYDMWLRMFSMGFKFKRIPETIGDFLYRPNSISQSRLKETQAHDKEIQQKYSKK